MEVMVLCTTDFTCVRNFRSVRKYAESVLKLASAHELYSNTWPSYLSLVHVLNSMAMDPEGRSRPVIVDDDEGDHDDSDVEMSYPYQSSGYCHYGPQSFGSPNFQPHGLPPPPPHSMYYASFYPPQPSSHQATGYEVEVGSVFVNNLF